MVDFVHRVKATAYLSTSWQTKMH